jgi:two-component system phosphate regulon response regulator PhoB
VSWKRHNWSVLGAPASQKRGVSELEPYTRNYGALGAGGQSSELPCGSTTMPRSENSFFKPLVLLRSDDAEFYLIMSHILEVDGFATQLAGTGEEARHLARERAPQAIVVDCRPGSQSGAALCASLKQDAPTGTIPVVALIALGAEDQYIDLLKAGVDESFVRPIAPAKLLDCLRAKTTNGRSMNNGFENGKYLSHGDIEMSLDAHRVHCNGSEIPLGPIEFKLLQHLLRAPGRIFSRDELIGAAWPANVYVDARTVDVHIGKLRKSLMKASTTDVIRTVRTAGYGLDDRPQL